VSKRNERDDLTPEQLAGWVEFFGCADDKGLGDANIEWCDAGHSGAGWYTSCDEYPDEGSVFVSAKHEPFPELAKLLSAQDARDAA
jgi:hypothetical protein